MLPEPSQSRNGAICNHMFRRNGYRPDGKIGWAEARGERDPKSPPLKKTASQILILDGEMKLMAVCSSWLVSILCLPEDAYYLL